MAEIYLSDDPWKTSDADFPRNGSRADQLVFCINYAVLAPSVNNTQPWLFTPHDDAIELFADRSRLLPVSDPDGRDMLISCGAALTNLLVAIQHFGNEVSVQYLPDPDAPDLLARVRIGRSHKSDHLDDAMFRSIRRRRTIRGPFQPRPVPHELQRRLIWTASAYGCWLYFAESSDARAAIADLVVRAHHLQINNAAFEAERRAWIGSDDLSRRSGWSVPTALDWETLGSRDADPGQQWPSRDRDLLCTSPVLCVIGSGADRPLDWFRTGEALQRMLLRAEMEGVSASFMNQACQNPDLRDELRQVTGRSGPPQLLIRMGYATGNEPVSRRPVRDVVRCSKTQ
ncbi:MAG: nitroreductase [Sphaerobacteraceae bacterium]|nr:MAG: nitroreductase [Sphaerobacteraceae bacterium]